MIYIWSNLIQTCGHACVLLFVIISPNRLPQMTTSFVWPSKEWTPTLCDVMNVHCGVTMATMPTQICEHWRQLQRIQFWLTQSIWQQSKSEGFDSCDRPSNLKSDSNRQFFRPCDREILWMTSKNNRALLLYYVKLCASFQIHWWIQTGFTVEKRSIRVEIGDTLSRVSLKFHGWLWKTIGHLFYATSSFVQHFVAIGEFKLELQSGNAQSGSNSMIFRAEWPWNLMDDLEKQ